MSVQEHCEAFDTANIVSLERTFLRSVSLKSVYSQPSPPRCHSERSEESAPLQPSRRRLSVLDEDEALHGLLSTKDLLPIPNSGLANQDSQPE